MRRCLEPGQYLSIRYTERLAETVNGLFKAELINRRRPWQSAAHVELKTGEWVQWWNSKRLHGAADNLPPAESEELYWQRREDEPGAA